MTWAEAFATVGSILAVAFAFSGFPNINIGNTYHYHDNDDDEEDKD